MAGKFVSAFNKKSIISRMADNIRAVTPNLSSRVDANFGETHPSELSNKVLTEADFSGQFGILRFSIEEANRQPNHDFTPAVNKALAWVVSNAYDQTRSANPFVADITKNQGVMAGLMSAPVDLHFITDVKFGNGTIGDLYPLLKQANALSDVTSMLWAAQDRGHVAQAARMAGMGTDFGGLIGGFADVVQELRLNQFEGFGNYVPGMAEYDRFNQSTGFFAVKKKTDVDKLISSKTSYRSYAEDEEEENPYADMNNVNGEDDRGAAVNSSFVTDGGINDNFDPIQPYSVSGTGSEFKGGSLAEAAGIPQGVGIDFSGVEDTKALLRRFITGGPIELTGTDGNVYKIPGFKNNGRIGESGERKALDAQAVEHGHFMFGGVKIMMPVNKTVATAYISGLEGLSAIDRFDASMNDQNRIVTRSEPRNLGITSGDAELHYDGFGNHQDALTTGKYYKKQKAGVTGSGAVIPQWPPSVAGLPRKILPLNGLPQKMALAQARFTGDTSQRSPSGIPVPQWPPVPTSEPRRISPLAAPRQIEKFRQALQLPQSTGIYDPATAAAGTSDPIHGQVYDSIFSAGALTSSKLGNLMTSLARANSISGYPQPNNDRLRFGLGEQNRVLSSMNLHDVVSGADARGFALGQASARNFIDSLGLQTVFEASDDLRTSKEVPGGYNNTGDEKSGPPVYLLKASSTYRYSYKNDDGKVVFVQGDHNPQEKFEAETERADPQDQVMVSRFAADEQRVLSARRNALDMGITSDEITDESIMEGAAASNERTAYNAVVASAAIDLDYANEGFNVSAQIALAGIKDGWRKAVTAYMPAYQQARSRAEFVALRNAGVYSALAAINNPRPKPLSEKQQLMLQANHTEEASIAAMNEERLPPSDPGDYGDIGEQVDQHNLRTPRQARNIRKVGPDGKPMQTTQRVVSSSSGPAISVKGIAKRSLHISETNGERSRDKTGVDLLAESSSIPVRMANPGGAGEAAMRAAAARAAAAANAASGIPPLAGAGGGGNGGNVPPTTTAVPHVTPPTGGNGRRPQGSADNIPGNDPFAGDGSDVGTPVDPGAPVRTTANSVGVPSSHTTEAPRRVVSSVVSDEILEQAEDIYQQRVGITNDFLVATGLPHGPERDAAVAIASQRLRRNEGREEYLAMLHVGRNPTNAELDQARGFFMDAINNAHAEAPGSNPLDHTENGAAPDRSGGNRTGRPNALVRDAMDRGARRSPDYSPVINPVAAGEKQFFKVASTFMDRYADDHFDGDEDGARSRAGSLYQGYMDAEAKDGSGKAYLNENVEGSYKLDFAIATRSGRFALEGASNFNKRMGPTSIEANFEAAKARGDGGYLGGYSSQHGDLSTGEVDMGNGVVRQVSTIKRDGTVTSTPQMVDMSETIAKAALIKAGSTPTSSDPAAAAETIKSRVNAVIMEHVDNIATAMRKQGASETEIGEATTRIKDAAIYQASQYQKGGARELSETSGSGIAVKNSAQVRFGSQRPANVKDLEDIMASRPGVASKVNDLAERSGKTFDELLSAPASEMNFIEDGEMSLQLGGNGRKRGGSGGWQERVGNMRSSPVVQALYGAYMAKRMLSMAMGPMGAEIEKYGEYASNLGVLGSNANGDVLGAGEAGAAGRKSIGDTWSGRGAYQAFGAFTDANFYMSGMGEGASRFKAAAGVGVTVAGEAMLAGAVAGQMGNAYEASSSMGKFSAGLAKGLPIAGLAAAAVVTGGTAAFEIINMMNPGSDPISWSSIVTNTAKTGAKESAKARFLKENTKFNNQNLFDGLILGGYNQNISRDVSDADIQSVMTPIEKAFAYGEEDPDVKKSIKNAGMLSQYNMDAAAQTQAAQAYFKAFGRVFEEDTVTAAGPNIAKYGAGLIGQMAQYGSGLGYAAGSAGLKAAGDSYGAANDPAVREGMDAVSARNSQLSSQAAMYSSPLDAKTVETIGRVYGVKTQQQAATWTAVNAQMAYAQKGELSVEQQAFAGRVAATSSPMQGAFVSSMGQVANRAGFNAEAVMNFASNTNFTAQQISDIGTFQSGDLQGMSYVANRPGNESLSKYAFNGPGGNSIFETNGDAAMTMARQWAGDNVLTGGIGPGFDWLKDSSSNRETASRMLDTTDKETLDAFMRTDNRGGMFGIRQLAAEKSYNSSMASIGVTFMGIAAQRTYLMGSGTRENPGAGSAWGYEDQQHQMEHAFSEADLNVSETRMNMGNRYAIQRENLQWQGMGASQKYNMWGMDTNYNQNLKQRGWTQEDYQYQDTNRELGLDRGLVDLNENIRFSSGRERRILMRQKDRFVQDYNLQDEQIGKERGRTEEIWALEDERYKKQKEYTIELNSLEIKNFELNKNQRIETYKLDVDDLARKRKELDEQFNLREKIVELTRLNEEKSLERQAMSAGIQAQAIKDQRTYELALQNANKGAGEFMGKISDMAKYEAAMVFMAVMAATGVTMSQIPTSSLIATQNMAVALKNMDENKIRTLIEMLKYFGGG